MGLALLALVVWDLYLLYGLGLLDAVRTLGGATIFLVAVPLFALALLLFPSWEKEAASLLVSCSGFVGLNHVLTYLRRHPVGWPPPILMAALVPPLAAALTPLLSVNYRFARKPEQEPALANTLLSFFLIQIFPAFGFAYSTAFLPALKQVPAADFPAYMITLLFGGLIAGSFLARWLLRRTTGQQIRALLLPSVVREGPPPDHYAWLGVVLLLGVGAGLETHRGEWMVWGAQALGILAMFQLVWRIYREMFTPSGTIVVPIDTFQIPKLSVARVGVSLWVLMSLSAIAVSLIQALW
jgi:hypothetical protein